MEDIEILQSFFQRASEGICKFGIKNTSRKLFGSKKFNFKNLKFKKLCQVLERDLKEYLQEFKSVFQLKLKERVDNYKNIITQDKNKIKKVELYESYDEQSSISSFYDQKKYENESAEDQTSKELSQTPQKDSFEINSQHEETLFEQSGKNQLEDQIVDLGNQMKSRFEYQVQIAKEFDNKLSQSQIAIMKAKEKRLLSTKIEIPSFSFWVIDCSQALPSYKKDLFEKMPDFQGCMLQFPAFNINAEENKIPTVDRNKRISKHNKQKYKLRVIAQARRWGYKRIAEMYSLSHQKVYNWLIQSGYVKKQRKCSVMSYLTNEMIKELDQEDDLILY